jgi:Flp pilus assembly protein CpaB
VVSSALVAWLFTIAAHRRPVLIVTQDVPVGARLTAEEVGVVEVNADAQVHTMPADQMRSVVGMFAAVPLRSGSLLVASQVTRGQSPGPGQMVVSVFQSEHQVPALEPGDQVEVVPTPGSNGQDASSGSGGTGPLTGPVQATVDHVAAPDSDGVVRVDLLASAVSAPLIAQQASTGRLALAVTNRGG